MWVFIMRENLTAISKAMIIVVLKSLGIAPGIQHTTYLP